MVPFTNQFKCDYNIEGGDKDLTFSVKSCVHQGLSANFKNDYLAGMNFYSGLQQAL